LPKGARYCPSCGTPVGKVVKEELSVSADNLVKKVKELIREGNVRRIIIKDEEEKVLLEMPMTVGVVGVILAPWLAALGTIAALATRCTITVERRE
jgi:CBS domain-containing protein